MEKKSYIIVSASNAWLSLVLDATDEMLADKIERLKNEADGMPIMKNDFGGPTVLFAYVITGEVKTF